MKFKMIKSLKLFPILWWIQIIKNENEVLPKLRGGRLENKQGVWNLPKYLINGGGGG